MLEELGVAWNYVPAHPMQPDSRATNPFGKIPTLLQGDFAMYESAAINTYLGDVFRDRKEYYTILYYTILYYTILYYNLIQYNTILYNTILYYTII